MKIYHDYADTYKRLRTEYIKDRYTAYGADKHAVEETLKIIEQKEWIKIKHNNFKQAMTRIFERRPID
jgi:Trm5-related predicted tRNA methylase